MRSKNGVVISCSCFIELFLFLFLFLFNFDFFLDVIVVLSLSFVIECLLSSCLRRQIMFCDFCLILSGNDGVAIVRSDRDTGPGPPGPDRGDFRTGPTVRTGPFPNVAEKDQ